MSWNMFFLAQKAVRSICGKNHCKMREVWRLNPQDLWSWGKHPYSSWTGTEDIQGGEAFGEWFVNPNAQCNSNDSGSIQRLWYQELQVSRRGFFSCWRNTARDEISLEILCCDAGSGSCCNGWRHVCGRQMGSLPCLKKADIVPGEGTQQLHHLHAAHRILEGNQGMSLCSWVLKAALAMWKVMNVLCRSCLC